MTTLYLVLKNALPLAGAGLRGKKIVHSCLLGMVMLAVNGCQKEEAPADSDTGIRVRPLSAAATVTAADTGVVTGDLLWAASPVIGTSVFSSIEYQQQDYTYSSPAAAADPSYFTGEEDAAEGTVWHIHKGAPERRVEARGANGLTMTNGSTYFFGFKFKVGADTPLTWRTIFQFKAYGTPMLQNIPIDINYNPSYGAIRMGYRGEAAPDDEPATIFTAAVNQYQWYSIVIKIKVSTDSATGRVQVWWNGSTTPSAFLTGGTEFVGRTFDGSSMSPKWGFYNGATDDGHMYFSQVKIGRTYESVLPLDYSTNVSVFKNCSYGSGVILAKGFYNMTNLVKFGMPNDQLSSVKVPAGRKITLYKNNSFNGDSLVLTSGQSCLTTLNWNDAASSLKIE